MASLFCSSLVGTFQGLLIVNGSSGKASLGREHLSWDLSDKKELSMQRITLQECREEHS